MKTRYYDFRNEIDEKKLEEIIKAYKDGEVIAFPTETVYGLGADIGSDEAIKKIYKAKNRPGDNPLIAHIATTEQLRELTDDVPEKAIRLMEVFWPGPLTIILRKKKEISRLATAGLDTIGIRQPDHPVIESILGKGNLILVAPSANISGSPSPTTMKHVADDLDGLVYGIIDGGDCEEGIESTIIDLSGDRPLILRPGTITREEIEEEIGKVELDKSLLGAPATEARAPGMKYRHYAPKARVYILLNNESSTLIEKKISDYGLEKNKCSLLIFDENKEDYKNLEIPHVMSLGSKKDLRTGIKNLYRLLRDCDILGIENIFIEGCKEEGLGFSYMNRLKKAASHNYLKES